MSFINVNIHFVWSTKNRAPILDSRETRRKIWEHIRENAHKKNIYIDTINGYCDHCHCLVSMRFDQTIGQVMMLIKGESSFWINKNKLCRGKFEWQDEYYAVAVSPSDLDAVRKYIRDQEDHHNYTSFQNEIDEFIVACGFLKSPGHGRPHVILHLKVESIDDTPNRIIYPRQIGYSSSGLRTSFALTVNA